MITKERLQKDVDFGIRTEESAVRIYVQHLIVALPAAGFNAEQSALIRGRLETIARESQDHRTTLENIRERMTKEPKNAY